MINHFDFYMIRRPARSLESLNKLHQQLSDESLETALKAYFRRDAQLREAILVASPHLTQRLDQWLAGEEISEKHQLTLTLYKYLIRSSTRCTPFGLFSYTGTGTISDQTLLEFDISHARTVLSIDIELMSSLSCQLLSIPVIREQLTLYPNSSLYDAGAKYHYIERVENEGQSKYFISGVEKSDALDLALAYAENGIPFKKLAKILTSRGNSICETIAFVGLLLDNQILEAELKPKVTGTDSLSHLIRKLSAMNGTDDVLIKLSDLRDHLNNKNELREIHESVKATLTELGASSPKPHVVKADSFFELSENSLSEKVVGEISGTISRLMVLNQEKLSPDFQNFREKLVRRYGEREISLAMALDDDIGLGYGEGFGGAYAPMIEELELSAREPAAAPGDPIWQKLILDKYLEAASRNSWHTEVTDAEINALHQQKNKQRNIKRAGSFFVFGNLLASSQAEMDAGRYQFNLLACQGSSAVNMMGRFANGIPGLEDKLLKCLEAEQQLHPDIIFAEIVHLPENHAGNIMTRPSLYSYEIPFMGQPDVSDENRIPITDLMVSVRNGVVVLRSRRLNKRVIPRLSNMHNYAKGLPIYRFLSDLQDQDSNLSLHWDWDLLKKRPHLPRVTYKKFILSRQTWLIERAVAVSRDVAQMREYLHSIGTPRYIAIASGDNELMIDLDADASLGLLLDIARKNETTRVMEFLGHADNCLLQQSGENYFSEFIFPMIDTSTAPYTTFSLPPHRLPQENFSIGSEWLYVKIYTDEKSNQSQILPAINRAVRKLLSANIIELFFFVRYTDTDPHLRLRFKGRHDSRFYSCVLDALHNSLSPLAESGLIFNIQTDTYQREMDRYGYRFIALCERIFHFDSLGTMKFLHDRSVDEHERLIYALRKTDRILDQAGFDTMQRKTFTDKLRESFFQELNGDTALRKKLNAKYQQIKSELADALEKPGGSFGQADVMHAILQKQPGDAELGNMLAGLIHMMINRVFTSRQRAYEMVLYHCLFKHYDAQMARSKQPENLLPVLT